MWKLRTASQRLAPPRIKVARVSPKEPHFYPSNLRKWENENQIHADVVFFVYLSVLRFTTTKEAQSPGVL